jgi:hypothetical protein
MCHTGAKPSQSSPRELTESVKSRDTQRGRCYRWEDAELSPDGVALSLEGCQSLAAALSRVSGQPEPVVEPAGDSKRASALTRDGRIRLPRWAQRDWIVCHEFAHLLVPPAQSPHGALFMALYISLVSAVTGRSAQFMRRSAVDFGLSVGGVIRYPRVAIDSDWIARTPPGARMVRQRTSVPGTESVVAALNSLVAAPIELKIYRGRGIGWSAEFHPARGGIGRIPLLIKPAELSTRSRDGWIRRHVSGTIEAAVFVGGWVAAGLYLLESGRRITDAAVSDLQLQLFDAFVVNHRVGWGGIGASR